jgi:hypothetical protein
MSPAPAILRRFKIGLESSYRNSIRRSKIGFRHFPSRPPQNRFPSRPKKSIQSFVP